MSKKDESNPTVHPRVMTVNQVVAWNIKRAREDARRTQDDMAEAIEQYTGTHWTKQTISTIERAATGGVSRDISVGEIVAFARLLQVPISYFFEPPHWQPIITTRKQALPIPPEHTNFSFGPWMESSRFLRLFGADAAVTAANLRAIASQLESTIRVKVEVRDAEERS